MSSIALPPASPSPLPTSTARRVPKAAAGLARWFHTFAAAVMLVLAFIGFGRYVADGSAYPGRPVHPDIRTLVFVHALSMTAWLLLFLLQPLLIATRRVRLHRTIGIAGAVLAALVVIFGLAVSVRSVQATPADAVIWGLERKGFMAIPFLVALTFGIYTALAIAQRKRRALHRPLMLTGTLAAMSAAISRIDTLNALYLGTFWETLFGPFFTTLLLGLLLLILGCALTRTFDRIFALCLTTLALAFIAIMLIARSAVWQAFAGIWVN